MDRPSGRPYKRGIEFPHEGFVQHAIEAHFVTAGFEILRGGTVDLRCVHPETGESWHVEAKGVTTQIGLDFRAGLGQLVQGMRDREHRYGVAMPDTPAFRAQAERISDWVLAALRVHLLYVESSGQVKIVIPPGA